MTFYLHLKYSASFVALRSSWWLLHLLRQIQSDFTGQIQLSSMMWFLCEQVQTWPFSCLHVSSVAVNDVSFIDFLCHWRSTERLYSWSFSTEHNQSPNCWLCRTVELLIDRGIWSLVMDQILFPCTIVLDILEYVSLAPAKHLSLQRQRQCIIYAQWFIHASLVSFTEFHFNIKINLSMFLKKKKRAKKLVGFFFVLFWFGFFLIFIYKTLGVKCYQVRSKPLVAELCCAEKDLYEIAVGYALLQLSNNFIKYAELHTLHFTDSCRFPCLCLPEIIFNWK